MNANRGSKDVAILFHTLSLSSVLDEVGGQRHAPATLPPGKRIATYCTVICVGSRSSRDRCGKTLPLPPPPGFDPRTVQPITSRDTDYATPSHNTGYKQQQKIGEVISVLNSIQFKLYILILCFRASQYSQMKH
jgi:hypothetical protein